MSFVHSQGCTFYWGSASGSMALEPTTITVDAAVQDTIDITSMASYVRYDNDNSDKPFVCRDIDSAYAANTGYEVSIDFYATKSLFLSAPLWQVGKMRKLIIKWSDPEVINAVPGFSYIEDWAVLKTISYTSTVGEYVTGSATFVTSASPYMTVGTSG